MFPQNKMFGHNWLLWIMVWAMLSTGILSTGMNSINGIWKTNNPAPGQSPGPPGNRNFQLTNEKLASSSPISSIKKQINKETNSKGNLYTFDSTQTPEPIQQILKPTNFNSTQPLNPNTSKEITQPPPHFNNTFKGVESSESTENTNNEAQNKNYNVNNNEIEEDWEFDSCAYLKDLILPPLETTLKEIEKIDETPNSPTPSRLSRDKLFSSDIFKNVSDGSVDFSKKSKDNFLNLKRLNETQHESSSVFIELRDSHGKNTETLIPGHKYSGKISLSFSIFIF